MQIVWKQDPAVNCRTSCEHAWRCWKCAKLKVKHVVHTQSRCTCSKILEARGVNQESKAVTRAGEEAQDHQDESAEKENPTRGKNQSCDQADGNSPVPVVSQRRVSTAQTVHRQWRLTRYSIDTEVNISVIMQRQVPTERKSAEVARTQRSMTRSLRCQGWCE